MANDIVLTAAVRANLLALQSTQDLIDRTQTRLSTGLAVSSPIDDATAFFEAKALSDRAFDLEGKKSGIDQGISAVQTALQAIESIDAVIKQMEGLAISAKTATGNELTEIENQFNELRNQVTNLANDADYQGVNLVNSTASLLEISFSTDTSSKLTIQGVDLRIDQGTTVTGLTIASAAAWSLTSNIDARFNEIDAALSTLRGEAQSIGSNVALLQTRLDFTSKYVNTHEEGAGKLTLADINEEGANLVALQTRQQLGIGALAFAGQAEQSILRLFQ